MHLPDFEKNVEILRKIARKKLVVIIPMRGSYTSIEMHGLGAVVMFRSFSGADLAESRPNRVIKHEKFSTVIYSGNA